MWTIFKVFLEFVTILLLVYILVFWLQGMWDLRSLTRDRTCTLCPGRWSPKHWAIGKSPLITASKKKKRQKQASLSPLINAQTLLGREVESLNLGVDATWLSPALGISECWMASQQLRLFLNNYFMPGTVLDSLIRGSWIWWCYCLNVCVPQIHMLKS